MSKEIKELKGVSVKLHAYGIAREADGELEALVAENDRLKAEVERLRGEQRLKSLIGPSESAVERIIAERDRLKAALERGYSAFSSAITERDSLRKVVNNLSCNWIDCPDCDRNRELMESFLVDEKKGE